jgi:lipopolysaccharide transport system ATP-binding protein
MKSSLSIEVINLSKKYRLGTIGMSSLREDLSKWWGRKKSSKHSLDSLEHPKLDQSRINENGDFLALDGLNFSVSQGEVIGIIGANGSGKSTLLKILSRITEPSSGKARIRGKVASLLEVGTGFHPELTGRENIYINGAILGMSRKEVNQKYDEIVEFSGVGDFLDTPVKRYSSGMTIRLGFAVAAHLEPDILIVDEVLAVGDASFQKKCIGKMQNVAGSGRTVLFVSHNMNSVSSLCDRGILLKNGSIQKDDSIHNVIDEYLSGITTYGSKIRFPEKERPSRDRIASLHSARMVNKNEDDISSAECADQIGIEMIYEIMDNSYSPTPCIDVSTSKDELLFMNIADKENLPKKKGVHRVILWLPENLFNQGSYLFSPALVTMEGWKVHFYLKHALALEFYENLLNRKNAFKEKIDGLIKPKCEWDFHSF